MSPSSTKPSFNTVKLEIVGSTQDEFFPSHLTTSPVNNQWALRNANDIFIYNHESLRIRTTLSGAIQSPFFEFNDAGTIIHAGVQQIDPGEGTWVPTPPLGGLAQWVAQHSSLAPPDLRVIKGRYSPSGDALVVLASGHMLSKRKKGRSKPPSHGDAYWLLLLHGKTHKPQKILWHGNTLYSHELLAISNDYIAFATELKEMPLRVFSRSTPQQHHDLQAHEHMRELNWRSDGSMLMAVGGQNKITLWNSKQWDAPLHAWHVDAAYLGSAILHPTLPLIFTAEDDHYLRVWTLQDQPRVIATLKFDDKIFQLGLLANQNRLLVSSYRTYYVNFTLAE